MKYIDYLYDDIPKYRKQRKNSRKPAKLKHKHVYESVIVNKLNYNSISLGGICTICGKIKITKWLITIPVKNSNCVRVLLSLEDVKENYPNLRVIEEV